MKSIQLKALLLPYLGILFSWNSLAQDFNVLKFGANGTDQKDDTEAIQAAIKACNKNGGGRVFLPSGTYFCGPLFLESNLIFEVGMGATLHCTNDIRRFFKNNSLPTNEEISNWTGLHSDYQWINGENLENVRITGDGKLNGRGPELWWGKQKIRPYTIKISGGKNIQFENLWVEDTPFHTFHFSGIEKLRIEGITLRNDALSPNTDAFHIVNCKNVLLTSVDIATGDDCILTPGSENIVISNSRFKTPWGFWWPNKSCKNIMVNNCIIECQFLVKDFREAEDVIISNIVANGPGKLFSSYGGPLKNILIENVRANGWSQGGWFINGENITLSNVHITRKKGSGNAFLHNGFDFKNVRGLYLQNVRLDNVEEGAAFYGQEIIDLQIDGFVANGIPKNESIFQLHEVVGASFENVRSDSLVDLFHGSGLKTSEFKLGKNKLPYTFMPEVRKEVVQNLNFEISSFKCIKTLQAHQFTPCKTVVKNKEDKAGAIALELFVDKVLAKRTWVWLEAFEEKEIQVSIPPLYEEKNYEISLNDRTFLRIALTPAPAQLEIIEVKMSMWDKIVPLGTEVPIEVLVQNIGSKAGIFALKLKDQEKMINRLDLPLNPGEKKWHKLFYTSSSSGLKKLSINDKLEMTVKFYEESLRSDFLHYTFDTPKGDTVLDITGLSNHAWLCANRAGQKPLYTSNTSGNALKFNGESAYVTIPNLLLSFPMSISMRIKAGDLTSSSTAGRQMVLYTSQEKGNDGYGPEPELHFMRAAGNTYSMWSNINEKRLDLRTDILNTEKWDHVTIVMDTTSALYVNGELKSQMEGISPPNFQDFVNRIFIGRPNVDYLRYFNGQLDDLRFFKEPLKANEVKQLYASYAVKN